jgi:uncharacterized alkaline shock family protein YloU
MAIKSIVGAALKKIEAITKVDGLQVKHLMQGDEDLGLKIVCGVVLTYGNHIPTLLAQAQKDVRDAVEFMTGMIVHEVNIQVKTLYVKA